MFPSLGLGLGLRVPHYSHILKTRPKVSWFEVITENFMGIEGGSGGRPLFILEKIRETYPIVLHGVSLSIGSADSLNQNYLRHWKQLIERFEPAWVSDHLCWTGVDHRNLHDLLPLPFTEESLAHVVSKITQVQEYLGRRILIENVSSYLTYTISEMKEWEFLAEVCTRADCGLLLDVNNVYVSSVNHGFDPITFLEGIPKERVGQFHLAGYSDMDGHLIDTHDHAVSDEVWQLYGEALRRFGDVSTLLERDDKIPEFDELIAELNLAAQWQEKYLGKTTAAIARRNTASAEPSLHA